MRTLLLLCAVSMLAVPACGGSGDCKNIRCMTGTNTYTLCGDVASSATYKFGGTSCTCTSTDSAACTSCSAKLSSYCSTPVGDAGGTDGATAPDLSMNDSTCSIVGTFKGMTTGGSTVTLTSTGTSTSGSYTLSFMTPTTYISGNYAYENDSLTMTNASSSATPTCINMAEVLSVAWANSCKTITFTKTTDACTGRTADLNGDTLNFTIVDMSI